MSCYFLKLFYALLLLLLHAAGSILGFNSLPNSAEIKCIESERQALLNFKHGLIDGYGMLSTWRDDDAKRDCCKWKGIQCNNQTGHVEMLHLRGQDTQYLSGAINISSLIALENIEHLDLSNNVFEGSHISELMGSFTNLRYLNLSYSLFGGSIPSDLGKLTHLLSLDLGNNYYLHGQIPYQLGNLTDLQYLDLSYNDLHGELPYQLGNLSQLRYLDLAGGNSFSGALPFQVGNLPLLHTLGLGGDFDVKSKDAEWLTKLSSLTKLKLSSLHNLSSSHHWLQMISKLIPNLREMLRLSYNRLTGMLPKSIRLLSELEDLNLVRNSLEGEVTESHLSNFSKLEDLTLSENSLSVKLVPSWVPPFQLSSLELRSCKLGPTFPSWLKTQSSLNSLDISDNGINDSVPDWFWNNLQYMGDLNMSFNYLIGSIPNISFKLRNRPSVHLNTNQFEGKIPSFLLQAFGLILSENNFSDLFSFLCDQSTAANFDTLDVSHNQIKGQLPDCWKSVKQLVFLDLSSNKLSGKIPMSMGALVNMEALVLRNNGLMGELPSSLKNCSSLFMLDLSENMLSGPIPSWIGESMHQLIILNMRGNHLSGNLPIHLCYLKRIQLLDLSRNNLSSGIPSCLKNLTAMSEQTINSNDTMSNIYGNDKSSFGIYGYIFRDYTLDITWMWKGVEQGFKNPELKLKSIDLSSNHLTGEIPKEVGYLLGNHISGRIPSSLSEIDYLGKLDLSHNSLSGRIPSGRHFETFEASSFEGNIDLCGEQLNKTCPGDGDQTTAEHQEPAVKGDDSVFYEGLYMSLGIGYFTGFWGLLGPLLLWRPWRIAYMRFLNRLTDYVYVCLW
ncbi:Receptor-like protein 12 [Glycine soja]|uniref:Receptor-like protein 12 n=1 Tax=Glycine soja TaxID=3848 RepID=A0A0B2PAV6_GLYSO|nr:Receptor-like protein 12 [Glycine soja]